MLATAAHSPLWNSSQGYVCLACRRQWQRTQRRPRQVRWNSELASSSPPPSSPAGSDHWFDTINDISDMYGDKPPTPTPRKPRKDDKTKSSDERTQFDVRRKKDSDDSIINQSPQPASLQRTLKEDMHAPKPSTVASLQPRLQVSNGGPEHSPKPDFASAFLSGTSRHKVRRKDAQPAMQPGELAKKSFGPHGNGKVQSVNDLLLQLVPGLTSQTKNMAAQQDAQLEKAGQPQRPKENEQPDEEPKEPKLLTSVHFPAFQSPARAGGGPAPVDHTRTDTESSGPPAKKIWKAKTSPASSGLGSLVSRARDQIAKIAEWGGGLVNGASNSPSKATYNSLSKSDTVSPKKPILTAVNAAPFGMKPSGPGPRKSASEKPSNDLAETLRSTQASSGADSTDKVKGRSISMQDMLSKLVSKTATGDASTHNDMLKAEPHQESNMEAIEEANGRLDEAEKVTDHPPGASDVSTTHQKPDNPAHAALAKLHSSRQPISADYNDESVAGNPGLFAPGAEPLSSESPGRTTALDKKTACEASGDGESSTSVNLMRTTFRIRRNLSNSTLRPTLNERSRNKEKKLRQFIMAQSEQQQTTSTSGTPDAAGLSIGQAMGMQGEGNGNGSSGKGSNPADESELVAESEPEPQTGTASIKSMAPNALEVKALDIPQPPVPYLEYGLDRVLFNPGVYQLQDPASRVYNFDPYLQKIMPVAEFDFNSLKEYKTSSQDKALSALAREHNSKYIGSTSSMTSSLAHFHYLLSNWRPLNYDMLSKGFIKDPSTTFTRINKAPSAIFLRWKNGTYAIDADKEFDSANVLMLLGKSMELLLTLPNDEYEKYRKSDPRAVPEEQKSGPEAYQYTTMGDFLMRSQLDAYDPRLPGNGTFDLKTRAVVSIRMQAHNHEEMTGYEIFSLQGRYGSYEREYHDMIRSTMLKYMLQARMGRMNGIFVAYHNVKRIFGFQYIPISDMDRALHGQSDTCLGDQEFKASLQILNEVLDKATAKFPEQSLRIHFETREAVKGESTEMPTSLHIFAEPMADEEIDTIQNSQKEKIKEYERTILGKEDAEEEVPADADAAATVSGTSNVVYEQPTTELVDDEARVANEQNHEDAALETQEHMHAESSDSHANKPFLNKINTPENTELKPLFYATVICLSRVNGEVPAERPGKLSKDDKWEVDYIIKEYEIGSRQWALYEDMKARRKHALYFDGEDEDSGDAESDARDKRNDQYMKFLKQLSVKGGEMREKIDQLESGAKVVRVDQPLRKHREKIESLEDYMEWMYKKEDGIE